MGVETMIEPPGPWPRTVRGDEAGRHGLSPRVADHLVRAEGRVVPTPIGLTRNARLR